MGRLRMTLLTQMTFGKWFKDLESEYDGRLYRCPFSALHLPHIPVVHLVIGWARAMGKCPPHHPWFPSTPLFVVDDVQDSDLTGLCGEGGDWLYRKLEDLISHIDGGKTKTQT